MREYKLTEKQYFEIHDTAIELYKSVNQLKEYCESILLENNDNTHLEIYIKEIYKKIQKIINGF